MRAVEASLLAWRALGRHRTWGQALRAEAPDLESRERPLAESLLFRALRRRALWLFLTSRLSRRGIRELSPATGDALIIGLAGVVEMPLMTPRSLVNAFVQRLSLQGEAGGARLVNGLLRRCHEEGIGHLSKLRESGDLRDQALLCGFPDEGLSALRDSWGVHEARRLMKLLAMRPSLSFRVTGDPSVSQLRLWPSPHVKGLWRSSALLPDGLPSSYVPQSESSARLLPYLQERLSGREGFCFGKPQEEGRLLSPRGQVLPLWSGDEGAIPRGFRKASLPTEPLPWIFVEPSCSESGCWARLPERKWAFRRNRLVELAREQEELLSTALDHLLPGGVAIYRTRSLFKEENEQVVARVLAARRDSVEWAVDLPRDLARRGRPWGYYVLPESPWADGTFVAVLVRRS